MTDPVNGQPNDATVIANNNAAIKTVVNGGIDNSNISPSASIVGSKISLPYASYTPTWTASGTAPAIGNSTVTAIYTQVGNLVHAAGQIIFGSTATFGTGSYSFALPVAPALGLTIGNAYMLHSGSMTPGVVRVGVLTPGVGTMVIQYGATYGGTNTQMGQTTPYTWASTDLIEWNITYKSNT